LYLILSPRDRIFKKRPSTGLSFVIMNSVYKILASHLFKTLKNMIPHCYQLNLLRFTFLFILFLFFNSPILLAQVDYFRVSGGWEGNDGDGASNDPNEMIADFDDGTGRFPNSSPIAIPINTVQNQNIDLKTRLSNDDMTPYGQEMSEEIEDYLI